MVLHILSQMKKERWWLWKQNGALKSVIRYKYLFENTDTKFAQQNTFQVEVSSVYSDEQADKSNCRTKWKCSRSNIHNSALSMNHLRALGKCNITRTLRKMKMY